MNAENLRSYLETHLASLPNDTAADLPPSVYGELRKLIEVHPVTPLSVVAKRLHEACDVTAP